MGKFKIRSLRSGLVFLAAGVFFLVWIIGFGSSILGARCLSEKTSIDGKLMSCRWAALLPAIAPADRSEVAAIEFERSIALIESGSIDKGLSEMRRLFAEAELSNSSISDTHNREFNRIAKAILRRAQRLDPGSEAFRIFAIAMHEITPHEDDK